MPSILKIRVNCARDLPVMDRSSELADAYAEIRFGDLDPQRTDIARKTLNPVWNHEFRFEISDDSMLQNEPLEIQVLDYDAITANDAVGSVLIDLDPLLQMDRIGQISGWFPLYDTLRGIRGEVHVQVKLQFFGDVNPFKQSSAGVQFFSNPAIPPCYTLQIMYGFVDALVIADDPEYHWSDSFRTPRSSNEARQKLLFRLSGRLRRILGKKALEQGGNAIVGLHQYFDLEHENKYIVGRAFGTACYIVNKGSNEALEALFPFSKEHDEHFALPDRAVPVDESQKSMFPFDRHSTNASFFALSPTKVKLPSGELPSSLSSSSSISTSTLPAPVLSLSFSQRSAKSKFSDYKKKVDGHRSKLHSGPKASSSQHQEAITTKFLSPLKTDPISLNPSVSLAGIGNGGGNTVPPLATSFPLSTHTFSTSPIASCIHPHLHTSATTTPSAVVGPSHRKQWIEQPVQLITLTTFTPNTIVNVGGIVSAKSVKLFGYEDTLHTREAWWQELRDEIKSHAKALRCAYVVGYTESTAIHDDLIVLCALGTAANLDFNNTVPCRFLHIPYSRLPTPFPMAFNKCMRCRRRYVPQWFLTTIEPPAHLAAGPGILIEAILGRSKKKKDGEANAANVSDVIPFTEYDLHKQLIEKLKKLNKNAIFGLQLRLSVGDEFLVAVATGTAYCIQGLPLVISSNASTLSSIQLYPAPDLTTNTSDSSDISDTPSLSDDEQFPSNMDKVDDNPNNEKNEKRDDIEVMINDMKLMGNSVEHLEETIHIEEKDELNQSSGAKLKIMETGVPPIVTSPISPTSSSSTSSLPWLPFTPCYPSLKSMKDLRSFGHQLLIVVKQASLQTKSQDVNQQLLQLFETLYTQVKLELSFSACVLTGVNVDVSVVSPTQVQLRWSGLALGPTASFYSPSVHPLPVQITPLTSIPCTRLQSYFGKLSLHFVKEANLTLSNYDHGGMGLFVQLFWAETLAVLCAHVQALGGNALVAFRIEHALFLESIKSQAYSLISISGDVCELTYED